MRESWSGLFASGWDPFDPQWNASIPLCPTMGLPYCLLPLVHLQLNSYCLMRLTAETQDLLTDLKTPQRPHMAQESSNAVLMEGARIPDAFLKVLERHLVTFGLIEGGNPCEPPRIPLCRLRNMEVVCSL